MSWEDILKREEWVSNVSNESPKSDLIDELLKLIPTGSEFHKAVNDGDLDKALEVLKRYVDKFENADLSGRGTASQLSDRWTLREIYDKWMGTYPKRA
jgi:hypothetical protein